MLGLPHCRSMNWKQAGSRGEGAHRKKENENEFICLFGLKQERKH